MGYFVNKNKSVYKICQASDSFSQFEDLNELCEYLNDTIKIIPTFDFDSESTAEVVINELVAGAIWHREFHLTNPAHWCLLYAENFENMNFNVLFSDYHEFDERLNKAQCIAALNRLLCGLFEGEVTDVVDDFKVKIKNGNKTIEAELCDDEYINNRYKYMFKIASHLFIGFNNIDFASIKLPTSLGRHYYSVKTDGDRALCEKCVIENYHSFDNFFDGLDPLEHEPERFIEILNEVWDEKYHQKAKDMLANQLLKDFGGEVLNNVEIIGTEGGKDSFSFYDSEMSVVLSFDKEWLTKWWVDSKNMRMKY